MFRDENDCRFEGRIYREPLFTMEFNRAVIEIRIQCKCISNTNTTFNILLNATGTLAEMIKEKISVNDKIKVRGMYAPVPVKGNATMILPKFNISELTILEKKLSDFRYNYKEEE